LEFEDSTTVDPISSVRLPPQICAESVQEACGNRTHFVARFLVLDLAIDSIEHLP